MSDWEEVAYSIEKEQSRSREEREKNGKWKFEEVAFTMADSPEKGKVILDLTLPKLKITPSPRTGRIILYLTLPKLEITPNPADVRDKLESRFRRWLVRRVMRSGAWFVYRTPTPEGDIWELKDMRRNIVHDPVMTHPLHRDAWRLI